MLAAGYQMKGKNVATDFLEKILSRKCKIHQQLPCDFIHLIPSEFSPRLCCKCMEVRKIPLSDAISIRLLLEATSFSIFNAYPKFTDNSVTDKIQNLKDSNSIERIETDFSSFFNKLNSTVSQAIEKVKYQQKQQLSSLSNSYQDVFNSFAKISQIEPFQELAKSQKENDDKLKSFIQSQHSEVNNYTEIMNNKLLKYQQIEQSFSLSDANNRLQSIVELINGITVFSTRQMNYQQLQEPLFQQQNQSQQLVLEHKLPVQQPPQQQQQRKQQQQLRQQEQKIQQPRKQESLQNIFSKQTDYDYYDSLCKKIKEKVVSLSVLLSYSKQEWEAFSEQKRQDVIRYLQNFLN